MVRRTKKDIITELFKLCENRNDFVFNNDEVKEILVKLKSSTNPYDMTKLDDTSKLPDILLENNYCIVHLGNGRHKFIKGINNIFHEFEDINKDEIINWIYRPSILNDFSHSESSILSTAYNHRILHDFLYLDIVSNPKIYNSERKQSVSFDYQIKNTKAKVENLQIEIDLTAELNGLVTVFEGKNIRKEWHKDFNVHQLYNPFRYYYELQKDNKLPIKKITACYLLRKKEKDSSVIRLYNYTFNNPLDITSIKLIKKREYRLEKRNLGEDDE